MRPLLWILNSGLAILLIGTGMFVYLTKISIPAKVSIKPETLHFEQEEEPSADISAIYENDLFNTYTKPTQKTGPEKEVSTPIPEPPKPKSVVVPKTPEPEIKPPLDIALKGTVVFNDDSKNIAMISDNKSHEEKNYKVGDTIEDAQLVRIFHNKIILIRSNEQQEIVFFDEKEAQLETSITKKTWDHVVKKDSEAHYLVDPSAFVSTIPMLSQFIDLLDLTTVYKQGQSIGCRIGKYPDHSIAPSMGLTSGDIIKTINSIEIASNEGRVRAYNTITAMKVGDEITVEIQRSGSSVKITFTLAKLKQPEKKESLTIEKQGEEEIIILGKKSQEQIQEQKVKLLKERYQAAPTLEKIRKKLKENMAKQGSHDIRKRLGLAH